MIAAPKVFLVVDDNADSRFLLVKTLQRKFPDALIRECQESEPALAIVRTETLAAIVAHRAADLDGISLIRGLREANPDVIIVMVSGLDRTQSAIRAGATCFLNYDEWLRVGSLVTDLLSRSQSAKERPKPPADDLGATRNAPPAPPRMSGPDVEQPSTRPSDADEAGS